MDSASTTIKRMVRVEVAAANVALEHGEFLCALWAQVITEDFAPTVGLCIWCSTSVPAPTRCAATPKWSTSVWPSASLLSSRRSRPPRPTQASDGSTARSTSPRP